MIKKHTISFKNAWHGLWWALSSQPNYRIHLLLSLLALIGGFLLQISYGEFLVILLLITLGFSIETINTAIEETTDAISSEKRLDIGLAKDVAAGAMLVFAIGSFVIALVIFIPKIVSVITFNFKL